MSGDDLIRRSDAEAACAAVRDAERNVGEDARSGWDAFKLGAVACRKGVAALPADPAATAALRLAEKVVKRCELRVMEAYDNESVPPCYRQYWSCDWCSAPYRAPRSMFMHDDDCPHAAYRRAVAERSGT